MGLNDSNEVDSTMSDQEMDSVLSQEAPSRDIPMSNAPEPQTTTWTEDKFTHNGKEIKGSREQILQWATMGYNYPQRANELNQKLQTFEQQQNEWLKQKQEFEQKFSPYQEIDKFASENQDWWSHVQEQYKQKLAGATSSPEVAQLKAELAELKAFRDEYKTEKQSLKVQEEDSKLTQEIESIRKTYSNLDFDTPDAEGLSLEMRILKHAQDNNLPTFRAAFRDYYHDHLIGKAKEEGKELVSKEVQKRTKLGILSESSKPSKGLKVAENVSGKSYSDLQREAMEELGIA